MSTTHDEIAALEERLRLAELGPDPNFFEEVLAEEMIMVGQDGQPFRAKSMVVSAHQPGNGPKFTSVQMTDMQIVEHGTAAAVVTCKGSYEGPKGSATLKFMRVWLKKDSHWQIIAGSVTN